MPINPNQPQNGQAGPVPAKRTPVPTGGAQPRPVAAGYPAVAGGVVPARPLPVPSRPIPLKRRKPGELPDSPLEDADPQEEQTWAEFVRQAPSWLISAMFHMFVLIILGLWAVSVTIKAPEVEIRAEPMKYAEQLGDQLIDDSILKPGTSKELQDMTADKQTITPTDMVAVDDPFAAPLSATEFSPRGMMAASDLNAPVIGLALTGRQTGTRNVLLPAYGGNATTEGAVIKGLEWLAKQQKSDGLWSMLGPYASGGRDENVSAATAMALLAFQGQGHTHRVGKYKDVVTKGWKALLKLQDKEGNFVQNAPQHQRLYAQAQCTIAICELYGMTSDSFYRAPAELAIKYAIRIQDKQGGWRYSPGDDSDTSVTGWFVMALQSARMAKLDVPQETLNNITRYLDAAAMANGMYAYTPGAYSTPAVTAEGYLCRQYLGWPQNDQRLIDGVTALNQNRVSYDNARERDVYYWYYATQACHHMEGQIWKDWNTAMRQEVPSHQVKNGTEEGSWDPEGDKWGNYGGRLYVTCLSIYMLEVYYRHLPIYSGYKFIGGAGK